MSEETIWIVTEDTQTSGNQRNYREVIKERGVKVSVTELEKRMSAFLQAVGRIFSQAEAQSIFADKIRLDEIELSCEISVEGEVKLIGTGGKSSGKGGIILRFKRPENESRA